MYLGRLVKHTCSIYQELPNFVVSFYVLPRSIASEVPLYGIADVIWRI